MGLHLMPGVDLRGMSPQIGLAISVADAAFGERGRDCILTCVRRWGGFDVDGFHATGNAVDISVADLRRVPLPSPEVDAIVARLQMVLGRLGGGQFDIVDERPGRNPSRQSTGPHIHIEFDPK